MAFRKSALVIVGTTALATAALGQPAQRVTGPIATYWVSAQTMSGFGAPGAGGPPGRGGIPDINAMLGRGGAQHLLTLQLGSSTRPSGEPAADHLPPAALAAGPSLPLVTPRTAPPQPTEPGQIPREMQKPRGRMLLFWGCGEHAGQGQPVIIDFAQLASGQAGAAAQAMSRGLAITPMQPPSPSRNATYGEWPNERARTTVPPQGSLIGDHVVRGNYSPEIRFALAQNQDFLAPINLATNTKNPTGSAQLGWNAVPSALAYFATAMGSNGGEDIVLWSSSATQVATFALPDYISPADIARLLTARALMSPQTTSCAVPKEVVDAAPQAMVQLAAYGEEANFSYPPRPENRATPWNIEWQVKVRYRSQTGGLLGMAMPGMDEQPPPGRGRRGETQPQQPGQPQQQTPPPARPSAGDVLRGLGVPSIPRLPGRR
jgi:hypothetical protein